MDWKKVLNDVNRNVGDTYDTGLESLLDRLGLEQKRNTMDIVVPMLGVFGAGIAVGAALGVLFAPKPGDHLRQDLREQIEDLRHRSKEKMSDLADEAQNINIGDSSTSSTSS